MAVRALQIGDECTTISNLTTDRRLFIHFVLKIFTIIVVYFEFNIGIRFETND